MKINTACGFLCLASAFFIRGKKKTLQVTSWMPKKWRVEGGGGGYCDWTTHPLSSDCVTRFLRLLAACTEFGKWISCGWNSAILSPQLLCRIVTLFSPPCLLLLTIWPHFGSPMLLERQLGSPLSWVEKNSTEGIAWQPLANIKPRHRWFGSFAPSCCFQERGSLFVFFHPEISYFSPICAACHCGVFNRPWLKEEA